ADAHAGSRFVDDRGEARERADRAIAAHLEQRMTVANGEEQLSAMQLELVQVRVRERAYHAAHVELAGDHLADDLDGAGRAELDAHAALLLLQRVPRGSEQARGENVARSEAEVSLERGIGFAHAAL